MLKRACHEEYRPDQDVDEHAKEDVEDDDTADKIYIGKPEENKKDTGEDVNSKTEENNKETEEAEKNEIIEER